MGYNAQRLIPSAEKTVVPAKGKALVATDISIACPPGTYGRVAPRSGLGMLQWIQGWWIAVKHFIDTGAGVIDEDYRGPVKVLLFNHSDVDFGGMFLGWFGWLQLLRETELPNLSWRGFIPPPSSKLSLWARRRGEAVDLEALGNRIFELDDYQIWKT